MTKTVDVNRPLASYETRSMERICAQYEIERELADRLRRAPREERRRLYTSLYDELFRLVPDHPQLSIKQSPDRQRDAVAYQMRLLKPLLAADSTFLEIGPGDCALSFHVAGLVRRVYAVDVSSAITEATRVPDNFQLFLSDGCSVPVAPDSVDVVFSNQLMEHLHPDDAYEQLRNIRQALTPGGAYLCLTPNRLTGPHDISMYFDTVATGFHLREYAIGELACLFRQVGFTKVYMYTGARDRYVRLPTWPAALCECGLERLPRNVARRLLAAGPVRRFLTVRLLGIK